MSNDDLDLSAFPFADDVIHAGDAQIDWVKLLVYGPSGAGKTSLLSTMPDPLIVLLTEKHGAMTIKRVNPNAKIIFIEDKKDPKTGRTIKAKEVLDKTLDWLSSSKHGAVSVALDSLTDMQQILLHDRKGGKPGADVNIKEWGKLIDETKYLVIRLRNLNMHVGVICLSDEVQDNNNRLVYRPALAGKKLPSGLIQYFNLCCFQRKVRDRDAVGGAVYESVFDAGDEYYTKTHPALDPAEPPQVRAWIGKMAEYALEHGEGDMPTESSPISSVTKKKEEEDKLQARMNNPEIKAMFDKLNAPAAKREASLRKYASDDKLKEVLSKKIAEQEAEEKKKAERAAAKEKTA